MKKYLFGAIALFIAVASVAFTTAPKNTETLYFVFTGDSDSQLNDPGEWDPIEATEIPEGCEESNIKVCYVATEEESFLSLVTSVEEREDLDPITEVIVTRD